MVRPSSNTSRNPFVVIKATFEPRLSRRAFVATVVPWTISPIHFGSASDLSSADIIASSGLSRLDGTFKAEKLRV